MPHCTLQVPLYYWSQRARSRYINLVSLCTNIGPHTIADMWSTCIMDHISTTCLNSHIPPYYLPCLEAVSIHKQMCLYQRDDYVCLLLQIICQTPVNHSSELKDIAHLLYQSAVNTFPSNDDKTLPTLYAKSLSKVSRYHFIQKLHSV